MGKNTVIDDTLHAEWSKRGIDASMLTTNRRGTVCPATRPNALPAASFDDVINRLPQALGEEGPLVVFGAELGRGGMGIVRLAQQRSLDREVAVKTTLGTSDPVITESLLREAWISGHLEHPNVIPVYALYREDQAPLMLMKRVSGSSWSDVLARDHGATHWETHLRTLVQLCHAVHYAHERGFAHLDLKPDNVMIGHYGEIYLLDWGVSVSLTGVHPPFIPLAVNCRDVVGTPAYMSPEQAHGDGESFGPRTDVYLLGAVLYEIVTNQPPHLRDTMMECVLAAHQSAPPRWPEGREIPPELAAIVGRAMARDPGDRYASAAEFREALEDYLVHADSLAMAALARDRSEAVTRALESKADESAASDIDQLASEAEFGFRQALHVWNGNARAKQGLQELLEQLIAVDLERGRWRIASRRIQGLPKPRPQLMDQVNRLREAETQQAHELQQLRADVDLSRSARQRSLMMYFGAFCWTFILVGAGLLDRFEVVDVGHAHLFGITLFAAVTFSSLVLTARDALFANAVNRNVVALLALGWGFGVMYWINVWAVDMPFKQAVIGIGPLIAFVVGASAATVDRRLIPHAIAAIIGAFLQPLFLDVALEFLGLVGGTVLAMLGVTWRRPPAEATHPPSHPPSA